MRIIRSSATKKNLATLGQDCTTLIDDVLRSCREGGVAIPFPDSAEVSASVETLSEMSGSLNSDWLFGVIDNETVPCAYDEVAPFCLKDIWEGKENVRSCVIRDFSGIEKAMWNGNLRSTRPKGVDDWVIGVNYPPRAMKFVQVLSGYC